MKQYVHHSSIGEVLYDENIWTGKKSLHINGKPLEKVDKNVFAMESDGEKKFVSLKGNMFLGVSIKIGELTVKITEPSTWYEIACSVVIVVFNLIWGNSIALCAIVPIVGGAIGGAVSGLMCILNMSAMKRVDKVWKKLLIWLGMFAGSFVICFLLAMLILL